MSTTYTEYENWPLETVTLPARSRLYPLTPIGLGTAQVECLTSYLMRLAAAHCLAPGTLYRQVIFPLLRASTLPSEKPLQPASQASLGAIREAQVWNGMQEGAAQLVQVIEQLTCVTDLHLLTWLPWESVFSSQHLLRRTRAWCPPCFSAWRQAGQTIYEPLWWTPQVMTACPLHECALVEHCPKCRRKLKTLSSHARPGYCSWCQQWLGECVAPPVSASVSTFEDGMQLAPLWIGARVGELIVRASTLTTLPPAVGSSAHFKELIYQLAKSDTSPPPALPGVQKKILALWQGGRSVPRLAFVLQFCGQFNLSVVEFLTAMLERHNAVSGQVARPSQTGSFPTARDKAASWQETIRQTLAAALLEDPPPPLSVVAQRLLYASPQPLYCRANDLSRQVAERYHNWLAAQRFMPANAPVSPAALLEQSLAAELKQDFPRRPALLAREAGYEYVAHAQAACPALWQALTKKHRQTKAARQQRQQASAQELLAVALTEKPTPSVKAVARRLGISEPQQLQRWFPGECGRLRAMYAQQKEERLAALEAQLRAALSEEPPRALAQIASSLPYNRQDCYRRWPELCRAIAKRYLDDQQDRTQKKQQAIREQVHQVITELQQAGIHPTQQGVRERLENSHRFCFVFLNRTIRETKQELQIPIW